MHTQIFLSRHGYPEILLEYEFIRTMLYVDISHPIFDQHLFGHSGLARRSFLIGDPDIWLSTADEITFIDSAGVLFLRELGGSLEVLPQPVENVLLITPAVRDLRLESVDLLVQQSLRAHYTPTSI